MNNLVYFTALRLNILQSKYNVRNVVFDKMNIISSNEALL